MEENNACWYSQLTLMKTAIKHLKHKRWMRQLAGHTLATFLFMTRTSWKH